MKKLFWFVCFLMVGTAAHAQIPLRYATASQAIKIGPFVDSTDGDTEETALTINASDVKLSKNGGVVAAKNSGACTHDTKGWYLCTLDATDTNTVGRLTLFVHVSGALPVFREFQVLPVVVYDRDYASSATGFVDANVDGSVTIKTALCRLLAASVNPTTFDGNTTIQLLDPDGATPRVTITLDGEGSRTFATYDACVPN
jgi:hypothetical protein